MLVRWIGAFGKSESLNESLKFELTRQATDEVACEKILKSESSKINHARIGLRIPSANEIKSFKGDCWSVRNEAGELVKTRNPKTANGQHLESWANAVYSQIVVKNYDDLKKETKQTISYYAKKYNLEIVKIK